MVVSGADSLAVALAVVVVDNLAAGSYLVADSLAALVADCLARIQTALLYRLAARCALLPMRFVLTVHQPD